MSGTPFVSIETVNGEVKKVEGKVEKSNAGFFEGGAYEFYGNRINDVLNTCAAEGYELFDVDAIGNSKIYRLKLKTK